MVNTHFYRPPYGDLNFKQARYALRQGEIVMWSWMSYDFDQNYSVHSILEKAKEQIQGGDVLVFHENDKTIHSIKEIIPSIIQIIRDKELNFAVVEDRKSTRLNSSHVRISYAVFCLKKKKKIYSDYFSIYIYSK